MSGKFISLAALTTGLGLFSQMQTAHIAFAEPAATTESQSKQSPATKATQSKPTPADAKVKAATDENHKKQATEKKDTKNATTKEGKAMTPANVVKVTMKTNLGVIKLELDKEKAPITTENFVQYAKSNFYDKTIFHRVINGFMIQGGGFDEQLVEKKTREPIKNEASNGLKNERGTIAMARTNNPNSATAQFFINLTNNDFLNYVPSNPGYAVFGKVTEGMNIVDEIAKVKTGNSKGYSDVPSKPMVIEKVTIE